ncbi:uncharacterized protein KY384_006702 [Bacidia gigantensis]|uniref:uncharacterized protein n=1 Tax=Bacidia gigantensis TaxID=2732470 RepID=UPI001D04D64F|nr:uncharacterized protein KY384_006702 [Bacidia gigantensis]KAG8529013.1 hypothetical protein KY384_006702 [Bacidia gigantensis]
MSSWTSVATAIAAGLGALLLDFIRQGAESRALRWSAEQLKTVTGMRVILEDMATKKNRFRYINPFTYLNGSLQDSYLGEFSTSRSVRVNIFRKLGGIFPYPPQDDIEDTDRPGNQEGELSTWQAEDLNQVESANTSQTVSVSDGALQGRTVIPSDSVANKEDLVQEWLQVSSSPTTDSFTDAGDQGEVALPSLHVPKAIAFDQLAILGRGSYGEISQVRQRGTNKIYAQKKVYLPPRNLDNSERNHIENMVKEEFEIMQRLSHDHVPQVALQTVEEETFSILMLTVADCDLRHFLERCTNQDYPKQELGHLTSWFGCLATAVTYVHSKHILHGDIKPSNILVDVNLRPYLADFGCAEDLLKSKSASSTREIAIGTPVYRSPECPSRGQAGDVFQLGCVFSEMLTVTQRRSLEDYRAYRAFRYSSGAIVSHAFREDLPRVCQWIRGLTDERDETGRSPVVGDVA